MHINYFSQLALQRLFGRRRRLAGCFFQMAAVPLAEAPSQSCVRANCEGRRRDRRKREERLSIGVVGPSSKVSQRGSVPLYSRRSYRKDYASWHTRRHRAHTECGEVHREYVNDHLALWIGRYASISLQPPSLHDRRGGRAERAHRGRYESATVTRFSPASEQEVERSPVPR